LAIVAIIPARYGSSRLPGKPLADIHGKTLIERVHERVLRARCVDRVLVATDDERIAAAVRAFGGVAVMTSARHATGTDRIAEAMRATDAAIVVNVQGDEPLLVADHVDAAVRPLRDDTSISISTLSLPLTDVDEMLAPSVVKVVTDAAGDALYFSRSPIPHARVDAEGLREAAAAAVAQGLARKHVGVYVYRREALERFAALAPTALERAEGLEQLRALEHGMRIRVVAVEGAASLAVDTPADLERVRKLIARGAA
jgi:3-deoxy-manno-octulosonate cytidylyltransferase (CMP-KDO synthetase)